MNESYGKFIVLSEDAKEKIKNMCDEELNCICDLLISNIRQTEFKLMQSSSAEPQPQTSSDALPPSSQ